MSEQKILLEAGTNEVEIMEFFLGQESYGVNAAKIKQILPYDPSQVTKMANRAESILGVFLLRGVPLTLVDLSSALQLPKPNEVPERRVIVVTEFNSSVCGFLVDGVRRIHRTTWEQFQPLPPMLVHMAAIITGIVHIDGRESMILDFENILGEISNVTRLAYRAQGDEAALKPLREKVKVVVAEDSPFIRGQILSILKSAGYSNVLPFKTGKAAFDHICALKKASEESEGSVYASIDVLVTDIEMPEMDGLTLTKRVKSELGMQRLPVVLFSSLITEQMAKKCASVGGNAWISKPQITELIELIDGFCSIRAAN